MVKYYFQMNWKKIKLINSKHAFGPEKVFEIGSRTYFNEFSYNKNACIYKYPFRNMIKSDANIYLNNITKWQNTYENIFKIKT